MRPKTRVKEFEGEEKEVAEVVKAKVFEAEAVSLRGDLPAEPVVARMVVVVNDPRPDDSANALVNARGTSCPRVSVPPGRPGFEATL